MSLRCPDITQSKFQVDPELICSNLNFSKIEPLPKPFQISSHCVLLLMCLHFFGGDKFRRQDEKENEIKERRKIIMKNKKEIEAICFAT